MYLFFDTETTGLPQNYNAPASDTNNWPRLVQIAYCTYDLNGNFLEAESVIIKPDGFDIPIGASNIHRVTTERANSEGIDLAEFLAKFKELLSKTTYLVAHNIKFDQRIVGAEYYRIENNDPLESIEKICTMTDPKIIAFCESLPFRRGSYKWPRLSELHRKLYGVDFEEAHDAGVDIEITAKCFWELQKRGIPTHKAKARTNNTELFTD